MTGTSFMARVQGAKPWLVAIARGTTFTTEIERAASMRGTKCDNFWFSENRIFTHTPGNACRLGRLHL